MAFWPRQQEGGRRREGFFYIFDAGLRPLSLPTTRKRNKSPRPQKRGWGEKKKALFHVLRVRESVVRLVSVSRSIRKPPLFPTQRERTGVDKWDRDCSIAASRKVFGLTTTTAHPLLTNKCTNVRGLFSRKGKKMAEKGCLNSVFSDTAAPLGTTK